MMYSSRRHRRGAVAATGHAGVAAGETKVLRSDGDGCYAAWYGRGEMSEMGCKSHKNMVYNPIVHNNIFHPSELRRA
eukprot:scaffold157_cov80-Skeletonema_dohrnii-CCMP3373.AAC.1